jgi:hypothetical protein
VFCSHVLYSQVFYSQDLAFKYIQDYIRKFSTNFNRTRQRKCELTLDAQTYSSFAQTQQDIILSDDSHHFFTQTVLRDSKLRSPRRYSILPWVWVHQCITVKIHKVLRSFIQGIAVNIALLLAIFAEGVGSIFLLLAVTRRILQTYCSMHVDKFSEPTGSERRQVSECPYITPN